MFNAYCCPLHARELNHVNISSNTNQTKALKHYNAFLKTKQSNQEQRIENIFFLKINSIWKGTFVLNVVTEYDIMIPKLLLMKIASSNKH